jgi:hypothetical protein
MSGWALGVSIAVLGVCGAYVAAYFAARAVVRLTYHPTRRPH